MGSYDPIFTIELRKRLKAIKKNTVPIANNHANEVQTTLKPAPRYSIACPNSTKCVVGANIIMFCTISGMLSRGVLPPDSICSGNKTKISNIANCAVDFATVAINIPSDVVTKRCNAAPIKNKLTEPAIGTFSQL